MEINACRVMIYACNRIPKDFNQISNINGAFYGYSNQQCLNRPFQVIAESESDK